MTKSDTITVLAAPAEFNISSSRYAKSFNLLSFLSEFDLEFYSIVNDVFLSHEIPRVKFLRLTTDHRTLDRVLFNFKVQSNAKDILNKYNISLIHHINLTYRGYNLLSFSNVLEDYPLILGPAQGKHLFLEDDYTVWSGRRHSFSGLEYRIVRLLRTLQSPVFNYAFRRTLDASDIVVTVDEETKKIYSKYTNRSKIRVIPLGVNLSLYPFSAPSFNHEILSIGMLIKRKGFKYLIAAMPKILKNYPNAKLHILGEGPLRSYLEALVKRLGLGSNVILHGNVPREKVVDFFNRCSVFVHPSLSETFSPVRLEAMACGIPIVATNGAIGTREMIQDGTTGLVISPKDPDAIAESILKLFDDEEIGYKMSYEGRKLVERKYDWSVIAKKYYDLYCDLVR